MMSHPPRPAPSAESGHLLVGLMVLIAVMLILLTVTGQSWVFITRRDAEAELIFRGEEYARALAFYKAETGSYPLELKALMQRGPHRHRYIRRLYKDPLADDGKWGSLYLSPTGKGFINPYASRVDANDPFGGGRTSVFKASNLGAESSRMTDRTAGTFRKASELEQEAGDEPGYSELTPEEFQARGGEQQGLPIVGVVHKKRESGLKIWKNQANLNDWAFTLLLEGQETLGNPTGAGGQGPSVPLQRGVGDHTNPIFLRPQEAPGPDLGPAGRRGGGNPGNRRGTKEWQEEQERLKQQREQQEEDDGSYTEDPEDEGYPEDEEPPDEDPNEPSEDEDEDDDGRASLRP
jgi:type II secretory pathway pseudopilin PulG